MVTHHCNRAASIIAIVVKSKYYFRYSEKQIIIILSILWANITFHALLQGMATNFIIQRSIERGGVFPQEDVPTLCRLAGWAENSGAWRLYVKDVYESNLDTSGLIYRFQIFHNHSHLTVTAQT